MREVIFDIEGDSLEPTLIHCLSYCIVGTNEIKTITEYSEMRDFFTDNFFTTFIGHNIINFDIPVLERILNFKLDKNKILIDTLGLSWYLYPNKKRHGLEVWGETLGVEKPEILDWKNLKLEDYIFRCEQDVLINKLLFDIQIQYLKELYKEDRPKIIGYLMFKLVCAKEQVRLGWKLDIPFVLESLANLIPLQQSKQESLAAIMPSVKNYKTVSPPKTLFKKDGSLSNRGVKWLELLKEKGLSSDFTQPITVLEKTVDPNPTSSAQLKDYLFSLGWKPTIYKYTVTKKGQNKVPQISTDGEICSGIKSLYSIQPALENLESLSIINHRINILKGFLRDKDEKGYLKARIAGFTNTLRFTHRELVNLPTVHKPFGKEIRGALTCESNEILCGSDMSSLEDKTKQHYMFFFDPKYVEELQTPGFDPHLDIAVLSEMLTPEQAQKHKDKVEDYSEIRKRAKQVNFCLPVDTTEILTEFGWKFKEDIKIGDKIFTYNLLSDQLELKSVLEIPFFENVEVRNLTNTYFSFECTDNHRWVSLKRNNSKKNIQYKKHFVETCNIKTEDNIITSAPYYNIQNNTLKECECELLGWILTDGWFYWSKKSETTSSSFGNKKGLRLGISQKVNNKELEDCLKECELSYTIHTNKFGTSVYNIQADDARNLLAKYNFEKCDKHSINYANLIINMSYQQRERFLKGFSFGDSYVKGSQIVFSQNKGQILNGLLLCLTLNGYSYYMHTKGTYDKFENFSVGVRSTNKVTGQKLKNNFSRVTDVFCVNNENKTFIAKQNNIVTITGNSAVYGVGAEKMSLTTGMPITQCQQLLKTYWGRNKAVKKVAKSVQTKTVNDQMWLLNPISGFWYSLRFEKDIFSTLNQGSGVYCFDNYVREIVKFGYNIIGQFHDEVIIRIPDTPEEKEKLKQALNTAIEIVNNRLKLNVELGISLDFGKTYADIH